MIHTICQEINLTDVIFSNYTQHLANSTMTVIVMHKNLQSRSSCSLYHLSFTTQHCAILMPKILVKFQRVIPTGAPNTGGVGYNQQFLTNILLYLRNGAR